MSRPQIWNIEKEKDREKEKVGDRPAKLNEKKSDRELEREIKKKETLGPFIRGKIRRELDHLYEHVLSKSSVYLNLLLKCKFIIPR